MLVVVVARVSEARWQADDVFDLLQLMGCIQTEKLQQHKFGRYGLFHTLLPRLSVSVCLSVSLSLSHTLSPSLSLTLPPSLSLHHGYALFFLPTSCSCDMIAWFCLSVRLRAELLPLCSYVGALVAIMVTLSSSYQLLVPAI